MAGESAKPRRHAPLLICMSAHMPTHTSTHMSTKASPHMSPHVSPHMSLHMLPHISAHRQHFQPHTARGNAELREHRPVLMHMSPHMSTHMHHTCSHTGSISIRTKLERGPILGCHFTRRCTHLFHIHVHVCTANMHMVTHMSCTLSNHMFVHMSTTMFANMSIPSYIDSSCIFFPK